MSATEATLSLVFRARNLADAAVKDLTGGLDKIATKASSVAGRVTGAFASMANPLANAIGNSVENLAQGGSLDQTLFTAGAYMAGQLAEQFGGQLLERLAGSGIIAAISAPLAAIGTAAGGLISAAIPIGMAALPAILIGALVAVVALLITNPEIRDKAIAFGRELIAKVLDAIGTALGALGGLVSGIFAAAWQLVVDGVRTYIDVVGGFWLALPGRLLGLGASILRTIIDGLSGLPGAVANLIGDAFRSLKVDIGPFHIRGGGITIDLPEIKVPGFAGGVSGFPGGLAVVGERGPELVRLPAGADVVPAGRWPTAPAGGTAVTVQGISEADLLRMIDRGMFFRLQRAPSS